MNEDLLIWFAGQATIAAAIWGAIRADIKNIHLRMKDMHDGIDAAHERIDNVLLGMKGSKRG